jgi:hypothetical protein
MLGGIRWAVWAGLAMVLAMLALTGCSWVKDTDIIGRWQAERLHVMSLALPIGPEIEITPRELISTDTGLRMPIRSVTRSGNEFIVNTVGGLGLVFRFEETDRMSIELPFVGAIRYVRKPA